jgi:hypothetical protein
MARKMARVHNSKKEGNDHKPRRFTMAPSKELVRDADTTREVIDGDDIQLNREGTASVAMLECTNSSTESATTNELAPLLHVVASTWSDVVRQKLPVEACIQDNTPTPIQLVYETLAPMLEQLRDTASDSATASQQAVSALSQLGMLTPYRQLCASVTMHSRQGDDQADIVDYPKQQQLRTCKVQVMVRLQLWSSLGPAFMSHYAAALAAATTTTTTKKSKKKKKQKRKQPQQPNENNNGVLFQDVAAILSLAAMRLSPDLPFVDCLQECLPKSLLPLTASTPYSTNNDKIDCINNELSADTLQRIFDHFEVQNPHLESHDDDTPVAPLSPVKRVHMKKRKAAAAAAAAAAKQAAENKQPPKTAASNESKHQSKDSSISSSNSWAGSLSRRGLTRPVSRTQNSLLAADGKLSRSRFVGSHFNQTLSNASSLFRQVQVPNGSNINTNNSRRLAATNTAATAKQSQSLSRKRPVPTQITTSTAGRIYSSSSSSRRAPKPSNSSSSISRGSIVHETPATKTARPRRNDCRVPETLRQPPVRTHSRNITAMGSNNNSNNDNKGIANAGQPDSLQSNANLVAHAFRAVQQRKR